ncbi:hypothetical protein J6590_080689 [Homalodisca vitripennis]|nr:hypothetical protein J6590_080689 [Homalodisca vitripennis]
MDFFLWGFIKDKVYVPPLPASLADLRRRITAAVAEVTPDLLERVWREIDYRCDICRITNGSHIKPKQECDNKLEVICYEMTHISSL